MNIPTQTEEKSTTQSYGQAVEGLSRVLGSINIPPQEKLDMEFFNKYIAQYVQVGDFKKEAYILFKQARINQEMIKKTVPDVKENNMQVVSAQHIKIDIDPLPVEVESIIGNSDPTITSDENRGTEDIGNNKNIFISEEDYNSIQYITRNIKNGILGIPDQEKNIEVLNTFLEKHLPQDEYKKIFNTFINPKTNKLSIGGIKYPSRSRTAGYFPQI